MDSEENKDLEIVMGGESDLEISEVGDIMNDLKPNTNKEKKPIIIPVSMIKSQNAENDENKKDNDNDESADDEIEELEDDAFENEDENNEKE